MSVAAGRGRLRMPPAAPVLPAYQGARLRASMTGARDTLVMTDMLVLFGLALGLFWTLDPFMKALDRIPVVKFMPTVFFLGAVMLSVFGLRLFGIKRSYVPFSTILRETRVLVLFAVAVVAGSVYARIALKIDNTFLNMGVFVGILPLFAWVAANAGSPVKFCRAYLIILTVLAAGTGLAQAADFGSGGRFHSREFLVIPLAVLFVYAPVNILVRVLGTAFFLGLAVAAHKNTAYIAALLVTMYIAFWYFERKFRDAHPVDRFHILVPLFAALAAFITVVTVALLVRETLLPSGNAEYRLHTYAIAWNRFLDSPLYGTLFTASATEKFSLYQIGGAGARGVLPTHSDPLDILAHGGVLLFGLFMGGLVMLWLRFYRFLVRLQRDAGDPWVRAVAHTLFCIFLTGFFTMSFNPLLLLPGRSINFWLPAALLLGLIRYIENTRTESAPRRTARKPSPQRFAYGAALARKYK